MPLPYESTALGTGSPYANRIASTAEIFSTKLIMNFSSLFVFL